MKKIFVTIAMMLAGVSFAFAASDDFLGTISLTYKSIYKGTVLPGSRPRVPAQPPIVYRV